MSIDNITLTAGMRNNILALQQNTAATQSTEQILATGKKVNSALDNPTDYFASQSMTQTASDLSNLSDGMANAVQTVSAANNGITAITSLIESAQGIAQSALATSNTTTQSSLAVQYNTILSQIDNVSSDSGFQGLNLLSSTNTLAVQFNAASSSTLNVVGFLGNSSGLSLTQANGNWQSASAISSDAGLMNTAITTLRTNTQALAANENIITTRQDFTSSMISTLQTGAGNLTLADMNEEGANMLALQTQQSLGISSLSMSSQSAQAVLKLFG